MRLFRRRKPLPPEAVDVLLRYLVEPAPANRDRFMVLVGDKRDAFLDKHYLYQVAVTALCLAAQERKDDRFSAIARRFDETVVFPRFRRGAWSLSSFDAAMRELAALEKAPSSGAKPLTWARNWFADIGVEILNIADLTLFVVGWQSWIFHMLKMLAAVGKEY